MNITVAAYGLTREYVGIASSVWRIALEPDFPVCLSCVHERVLVA